jgi:hypothetical protein
MKASGGQSTVEASFLTFSHIYIVLLPISWTDLMCGKLSR